MRKTEPSRSWPKLFLLLALFAPLPALAATLQLGDLMQLLAQTKSARASFIEKKYIGIIDKPVESSGELAFTAPDKLEKRTLKPKPEALLLDGTKLTVEQGSRRHVIALQDYPEVAAFVESIRGTLAGDRSALERVYRLDVSGSLDKWQLVLTPAQARMAKIVTRIRMQGKRAEIDRIEFEQADGDRSEMIVTQAPTP